MHKIITFLFLFSFCQLHGQNLLPNPSFEEVNVCKKYEEDCAPRGWRSTTLKSFRYNKYDPGVIHSGKAKDGRRYVTLLMHNHRRAEDRSFMQAPLLCPLEKGVEYELVFYINPPKYMLRKMGVYFTDSMLIYNKVTDCTKLQPQLEISFEKQLIKNRWNRVTTKYTATGNERGIVFGNFYPDEKTEIVPIARKGRKPIPLYKFGDYTTYYKIDHISLTLVDSIEIKCDLEKQLAIVYQDSIRHSLEYITPEIEIEIKEDPISTLQKDPNIKPTPTVIIADKEIETGKPFVIDNINFKTNSAVLLPVAYRPLEDLANYLVINRFHKIVITGHTDAVGNSSRNLLLSKKRAKSVAQFLIARDVHPDRISSFGKGENFPIADNETEEGKAQNRRVEFKILDK